MALAGRAPLMTVEEEIECGRRVQAMMPLLEKPTETLTRKEKQTIRRGRRARDRFVTGNMRMVASIARKYMHLANHMQFSDLCQEGAVGLARAAEKFDPARGYKFSTYSYWWIRQSINRSIAEKERMIRIPSNVVDQIASVRRHQETTIQATGLEPTLDESLEHAKLKREQWEAAIIPYFGWASTDKGIGHADGDVTSILDIIADPKSEEALEKEMLRIPYQAVLSALERIPQPSQQMVRHFYGIDGAERMNLRELGSKFHVSREAVRQRINKATLSLRMRTGSFRGAFDD